MQLVTRIFLKGNNLMLRLVIFDFDGVIIDSEPLMKFAFEESYKQVVGGGLAPIENFFKHMGESLPRIMDKLGLSRNLVKPYRDICSNNVEKIKMFPGTRKMLNTLASLNLKIVLLTGKDYERTQEILKYFHIFKYFRMVITPDSLWNSKPDPEGIVYILDSMDCKTDEAVMIGDSLNDIICARRAGVHAIGVSWGSCKDCDEMFRIADYSINDWDSLINIVLQRI